MTYNATGTAGAGAGVSDQSTTEQAKERAAEMAGQAQEKVRDVVENQVDQRSDLAADKVESVADDVRAVSESLSDRGQDTAARVVEQGAEYAQQLSDYLRNSSSDQILDDVAAFARRQPWAVAAGGLVLGFAASRVLRASAANAGSSATSRIGGRYPAPSPSLKPMATTTAVIDPLESPYRGADQFGTSAGQPTSVTSSVDGR